MIELPEALTIARQIREELAGARIALGLRGNSPHRFAFYNRPPDEYAALLQGKAVGEAREHGSLILVPIEPGYVLFLGGGGERILLHESEGTLPKKHQLLLKFEDGRYLTVNVSGWGSAQLMQTADVDKHLAAGPGAGCLSPLSDAFTFEHLQGRFDQLEEGDPRAVKLFVISKPGILGIGNGYLQDILFLSRIHPRRRAVELAKGERRALHKAIRQTVRQAAKLGGRDTERDLHNRPGGYSRILDSTEVGQPCPECGTPIEKIQFLGGASYFCRTCQV